MAKYGTKSKKEEEKAMHEFKEGKSKRQIGEEGPQSKTSHLYRPLQCPQERRKVPARKSEHEKMTSRTLPVAP